MLRSIALLALLTVVASTAAARTIDDFTSNGFTIGYNEGLPIPYTVSRIHIDPTGTFIIGGERYVEFTKIQGSETQPYSASLPTWEYLGYTGWCTYNSFFNNAATLTFVYGRTADLDADLTLGNADGIVLVGLDGDLDDSIPPRPVALDITLVSNGNSATVTVTLQDDGHYWVPFTAFVGIDPTDVDQIVFVLTQDPAINDAVDFAWAGFGSGQDDGTVATQSATWGAVKALFE